jgi:hypothetical protein
VDLVGDDAVRPGAVDHDIDRLAAFGVGH